MEGEYSHWIAYIAIVVLIVGTLAFASSTFAQEDEVWSMEEKYWQYVQAGDVDQYLTLWHDKFVGWPCSAAHPSRKSNIGDWVKAIRNEGVQVTYELRREAMQAFGDVAVVHYSTPLVRRWPDGRVTGDGRLLKFTHTWRKSGDKRRIIAGMCALAEPDWMTNAPERMHQRSRGPTNGGAA